jgi:protein kinase-like protein
MDTPRRCPKCGTELTAGSPEQLCPRCLLEAGLESQGDKPLSPPTTAYNPGFAAPTPQDLSHFFPQLEILELLGKGGMGAVYKARQPGLDRLVALKILPPDVGGDPAFAERFTREARALAKLSHPNIVAVFDFGQASPSGARTHEPRGGDGGLYYFLMEYVDGVNLRQALRAGHLKPAEALKIVPQICDALQFAHDEGVVHRDIKPENILLDKRGRVKIADFGLAKLLGAKIDYALTGTHQTMGTPHYMAPEQIQGTRDVDHRADIYSLGVTFYEMLTGELPLGRFALPSKKVHIDVRLDEVVLRALEVEPEKRYQHASDVRTEVDAIVASPIDIKISETARPAPAPGVPQGASLERLIADLLPDDKVAAVRIYRRATGAGLAQAISAVKVIAEKYGKEKPSFTWELVIGCLLGAAGLIAGGFWLALFLVGGFIGAVFWIPQKYTSRWFYWAARTLRWLCDRFVFLVGREWQWLRGQKPTPPPAYPDGETKISSNVPRFTLGSVVAGTAKLLRWLFGKVIAVLTLPPRILRGAWRMLLRAWWLIPLAWTLFCVAVFASLWRPDGLIVGVYWPYEGWSESNVSLRPAAKNIERIVISERRERGVHGFDNVWKLQPDGDKASLIGDNYTITLTPAKKANNFRLEADGLNRLAWRFNGLRGAQHGDLPLDLRTMVLFLNSCGVDWTDADVNSVAKPLLEIILLSFSKEHVGISTLGNQRPPVGRLETIVVAQERDYQQRMVEYPFSEHIGTSIVKSGPAVSILWVSVPVTLTLWAIGMLWLRRRRRAERFPLAA